MKILAVQDPASGRSSREFVPHLREEAEAGWNFYKEGFIREMYYKGDVPEVILMLEADSIEEAREKLNELPLVRKGLISFTLTELKPYHGYERLFGKS